MRRRSLQVIILAILLTGCGARSSPPAGLAGAPAPPAAVERFLHLAAERDYAGMGWIFGTAEGPILTRDDQGQVEQRMYALASLLEHDGFVLAEGVPVPGRTGEAIRFQVTLTRRGGTVQLPFVAVRGPQNRWFVEQLDVQALTGM